MARQFEAGSRSWIRGMRSVALVLLLVLLSVAACRDDETAGVGATVQVGDLDLTLVDFEMLDEGSYSALSDANARLRVHAVNTRGRLGEPYRFAPFAAFLLDDESGVGRGPQLCLGCEDLMEAVELDQGAEIGGWLYFSLGEGQHAARLRYAAPLSRNRAEFSLD